MKLKKVKQHSTKNGKIKKMLTDYLQSCANLNTKDAIAI